MAVVAEGRSIADLDCGKPCGERSLGIMPYGVV
jgi:hypothetical protein